MLEVVYYRHAAEVNDLRYFKDEDELTEWMMRQNEFEPISIVSIKQIIKGGPSMDENQICES